MTDTFERLWKELEDAKRALGPAWLAGGTLAEGIARKTGVLEAAAGTRRPRSRDQRVVDDVLDERARQRELGHADAHDYPDGTAEVRRWVPLPGLDAVRELADERQTWSLVMLEEVLEVLAEDDVDRLREELVQVAAVAVRWAGAIDGRKR